MSGSRMMEVFRENGTERMYSWSPAEEGVLVDLGVLGKRATDV